MQIFLYVLVAILAIASGIFKAVMDTLIFHYETSVFNNGKNQGWWNPNNSWKNKYLWSKGIAFLKFLFSDPLVAVTDAWHLFQALFTVSITTAFFIGAIIFPWWSFFIIYAVSRGVFHIFFTWIFKKKGK